LTSLFEPDGDRLVPTELARGPWSPESLHGAPGIGAAEAVLWDQRGRLGRGVQVPVVDPHR